MYGRKCVLVGRRQPRRRVGLALCASVAVALALWSCSERGSAPDVRAPVEKGPKVSEAPALPAPADTAVETPPVADPQPQPGPKEDAEMKGSAPETPAAVGPTGTLKPTVTMGVGSEFREVTPVTDGILMLYFEDGKVIFPKLGTDKGRVEAGILDFARAARPESYTITSEDDPDYARPVHPVKVGRKSKGVHFVYVTWRGEFVYVARCSYVASFSFQLKRESVSAHLCCLPAGGVCHTLLASHSGMDCA